MDLKMVLGAGVMLLVLFYTLKSLSRPLKGLGIIALRSGVAFGIIWAVNTLGQFVGFHMGLNVYSALTVGVLGIPGAALLLAVKYLV